MLRWDDPLGFLKGVTPALRKAFAVLGIETVGDLLSGLPRRYEDFSRERLLFSAQDGESVTLRVRVKRASASPGFRRRKVVRVVVEDASGSATAVFFNQPWLLKELVPGREILLFGTMALHPQYGRQVMKPAWRTVPEAGVAGLLGEIFAVYPTTQTLPQKTYRRIVERALEETPWPAEDPLGGHERPQGLLGFAAAVRAVHKPASLAEAEQGRRRFAFDEALAYRLGWLQAGQELVRFGGVPIPFNEAFARAFAAGLPFPLTGDQKRAVWTALQAMEKPVPMRRLLQGDVGSGKTAVAAFLAAHAHRAGASSVILAPTDILASQHAQTLRRLFSSHRIPLLLLTRTKRQAWLGTRDEELLTAAEADRRARAGGLVIVGTHAVLQEKRVPEDIGLVVVDEQHRFGVAQRQFLAEAARADGRRPHLLSMTATPIPRSLALALAGDLDVSSLREKPVGRRPVASAVCAGGQRETAYAAIRAAASRGEASFVVCPLIDPSDALGVASVQELSKQLAAGPLAGLRLAVLHGRLKTEEKADAMDRLLRRELDVLVSTSVIEVGVDVPHATVIAIEGAERFGMAQLHQLRGRVGRSALPSRCFFLTDAQGEPLERLEQVARTHDGFALAEEDFRRRGAGNVFGIEQSGELAFKAVRAEDADLLRQSVAIAERIIAEDPALERHPWFKDVVERKRGAAHLE